MKHSDLWCKSS